MADLQHVFGAALRPLPAASAPLSRHARLLVAGAAGALGAEVLHRIVASGLFAQVDVLTTEPMTMALPRVSTVLAGPPDDMAHWPVPPTAIDAAVVMFEPPRSLNDRERAFFTPTPEQLPALAGWLQRCGAQTLVVVLPHAPGRLPQALKRGLASLGESEVASLGFARVLLVRSAVVARALAHQSESNLLQKLANAMLSIAAYMIPAHEQPVQPGRVAEFIEAALRVLPAGTFVASTDLLHRVSQGKRSSGAAAVTMTEVVHDWLAPKLILQPAEEAPPA